MAIIVRQNLILRPRRRWHPGLSESAPVSGVTAQVQFAIEFAAVQLLSPQLAAVQRQAILFPLVQVQDLSFSKR